MTPSTIKNDIPDKMFMINEIVKNTKLTVKKLYRLSVKDVYKKYREVMKNE